MSLIHTDHSITSFSKLSSYLICPRKYRYETVDGVDPECTPLALIFGTAIHEAVELHFQYLKRGLHAEVFELVDVFRKSMSQAIDVAHELALPIDFDGDTMEEVMDKAQRMLTVFHHDVDRSGKIVDTEIEFAVELAPGVPIKGRIDALLFDGDGHYRIVEIKTAAASYGTDKLQYDHQPTTYLAAIEKMIGPCKSLDFEYWVLTKTKNPQLKIYPVTRDERSRIELIETINETNKLIEAGSFPRRRGWQCSGCQYAKRCNK